MPQVQGPHPIHFGLGPSLLAAIPFGLLALGSAAAPMPFAGPRIATIIGLGALAVGLAVGGFPRRTALQRRLPPDAIVPPELSSSSVLLLGLSKDRPSLPAYSTFTLEVLDSQRLRQLYVTADDPARLWQVAMRWTEASGCRVEVHGWSIWGDPLPERFEAVGCEFRILYDDWAKIRFCAPLARSLGIGGSLFVLGVIGSLVNAHLARSGSFTPAGTILGLFLGAIAIFLLHLGLATQFRLASYSAAPSRSAAPLAAASTRRSGRLLQGGIWGNRVRLIWNDDIMAIWLIASGVHGRSHFLMRRGPRIESVVTPTARLEP